MQFLSQMGAYWVTSLMLLTVVANANCDSTALCDGNAVYCEDFDAEDGSSWPKGWSVPTEANSPTLAADIQNGRGRLQGETGQVARIVYTGFELQDLEIAYTIEFEAYDSQGIGFYGRQNGGRLTATQPTGQGYAAFIQGAHNHGRGIGLWHEVEGVEILDASQNPPLSTDAQVNDGDGYRVRLQIESIGDNQTRTRVRMWAQDDDEPSSWRVSFTDTTEALQGASGGLAVDVYNYSGTGSIYIDDISVTEL